MTSSAFRLRLMLAIREADAEGFTGFAAALRHMLRQEITNESPTP